MRGDVHRRVYMRDKGWDIRKARLRTYATDCIYLYFLPIDLKLHGCALRFFTNFSRSIKYILIYCVHSSILHRKVTLKTL